jgi:DNA-binding NarL/FixJ family response regulator
MIGRNVIERGSFVVGTNRGITEESAVTRRVRVVVVDDNDDVRLLLRLMLERDDRFEVVAEAADGIEAIDRATETQPDLVVLDRSMPRLGGIEALPRIREHAPNAAVVLYTAYPDEGTHHAALAAGAVDVMQKSEVGSTFIDQLASTLLGHWAGAAGDMEVRLGPVDSKAALAWVHNTKKILRAVRQHPEALDEAIPDEVFVAFARFLDTWQDVAATNTTFSWVARASAAEVNHLVHSWAVIDRLTDDGLHALGCDWSPPEGAPFFAALSGGVLTALEAHADTRRLAAELRRTWTSDG